MRVSQREKQTSYLGEYVEKDEWSVLCSIAREGAWLFNELLAAGVSAQAFADSRAQFVWSTLSVHIREGRPMTGDALVRSLDDGLEAARRRAKADERFKPSYLALTGETLADIVLYTGEYRTDPETAKFLANRIVNRWRFKRAERELDRLRQEALEWAGSPEEFVAHVQSRIMALPTEADGGKGVKNVAELLPGFLDAKHEAYGKPEQASGVLTGYPKLDRITHGLKPGDVCVIAAGSGVGKTSFAMNLAAHAAIAGKRALIFSLEMTWEEIVERLVWISSQVNSGRYWRQEMTDGDWDAISRATTRMQAQNIDIVDDASITLPQIQAVCSREAFRAPIDLVIVDYAQLVQTGGKEATRELEVSAVSKGFKRIAGSLGVPVVILSQINDDGRIRESRSLYHDASHVWVLKKSDCQDGMDKDGYVSRYELEVAKGRNSTSGKTVRMLYFYEQTRLEEESDIEEGGAF